MTLQTRIDLAVPYAEKEDAKALGARWDPGKKLWYAPPGTAVGDLRRWLPKGFDPAAADESSDSPDPGRGVPLADLLARVKGVIERGLPEATWVRAEVAELREKNGNVYLSLTERNDRGDVLAQAKAVLWRSVAPAVTARFERATGEGLRPDIKVLCKVRVRFDPHFGLDLIVEDVDPSYTLGDLAAKLARIRERLVAEGLYALNKGRPAPSEFVRVAVISPSTSAGLGDFRREADRLQSSGLCEFSFYPATFQGIDAPSSIRTALNEALADHRRRPFDAVAIIRGGGSVTDLAWLNDLELARRICKAPVPILTGIGHERDGTILDEVAHRRFDTPSKAALHVSATIKDNALAALAAVEQVRLQVARILARERTALATQADRIESGVLSTMGRAGDAHEAFLGEIRTAARRQLREAGRSLDAERARFLGTTERAACEAGLGLERSLEIVAHRCELGLAEARSAIEKAAGAVAMQAMAKAEAAGRDLESIRAGVVRDATRRVTGAADDLACDREAVADGATSLVESARREVEASTRLVVGLGPQATLRRGFALARDVQGRPITSRESAIGSSGFAVEFHDGAVPVAVRESREGEGS